MYIYTYMYMYMQSLMSSISKPTKLALSKVGMFSVSSLHAIVSRRMHGLVKMHDQLQIQTSLVILAVRERKSVYVVERGKGSM